MNRKNIFSSNKSGRKYTNRRSFLKSVSGGTGALLFPTVGADATKSSDQNKPNDHKEYKQLRQKSEQQDWTIEEFNDALRQQGYDFESKTTVLNLGNEGRSIISVGISESDTSSQNSLQPLNLNKGDLYLNLRLIDFGSYWTGDLYIKWDTEWWEAGALPWDYISLGWSNNEFRYDGYYTNGMMKNRGNLFDRSGTGAIWRFNDTIVDYNDYHDGHVAAHLDPEPYSGGDRTLYAKYRHTWNKVEQTGWSFSSGGAVSVFFSNEEKVWRSFSRVSV